MRIGQLELQPVAARQTFRVGDASGYEVVVQVDLDSEWGWTAGVSFSTHGFQLPEAAVQQLRPAIEHFLRLLAETPDA
jgi:hypothetical protein